MEEWQIEFEWLKVRHYIKDQLGNASLPDMRAILLLIGIQELGRLPNDGFTKEEKQDLMHVAVCTLLEGEYYSFEGRDQDGWPHFNTIKKFTKKGVEDQESLLITKIISYFSDSLVTQN